jgi:methyl-accepting chemotaxis protein
MNRPTSAPGAVSTPPRRSRRLVAAAASLGLACAAIVALLAAVMRGQPFSLGAALGLLITALGAAACALGLVALELRAGGAGRHGAHRKLVELIPTVSALADHFIGATAEIRAMSGQQREGALRQNAAIGETRLALDAILSSAKHVADSAEVVYANAAATLDNNERVAKLVAILASWMKEIGETVVQLRAIASRSEVLALNAALEGRRAGEAGRGFSLVAAQMQQLTERIASSLASISALTSNISGATSSTQDALGAATAWAHSTTEATRDIAAVSHEQHASTEQIASAVGDISEIAEHAMRESAGIVESATALEELARELRAYVAELERD